MDRTRTGSCYIEVTMSRDFYEDYAELYDDGLLPSLATSYLTQPSVTKLRMKAGELVSNGEVSYYASRIRLVRPDGIKLKDTMDAAREMSKRKSYATHFRFLGLFSKEGKKMGWDPKDNVLEL